MFGQAHPSPSLLGEIFEVVGHVGEPLALGEVDKDSRSSFPLPVPTDGAVAEVPTRFSSSHLSIIISLFVQLWLFLQEVICKLPLAFCFIYLSFIWNPGLAWP